MTKSITSTLLGIRAMQTKTNLGPATPFTLRAWGQHDTNLTVGNLLQMSDGLDFDEKYVPGNPTTEMLFTAPSTLSIMPRPMFRAAPGACFQYSSLATNLLQHYLRESFASVGEYLKFPSVELFAPLGITTATMETDPSNVFVGSSFSYLTGRDWAKLGLFWLQGGEWRSPDGEVSKLLPDGWMAHAQTEAPTSGGAYGAQFWLGGNPPSEHGSAASAHCDALFPTRVKPSKAWLNEAFPGGTFLAHGFEEQLVAMVPSKGVVLVRLGATKEVVLNWEREKIELYKGILASIPDK